MPFLDGNLSLKPETLEYLRKKGRLPPQDESPPAELIDAFKQKPPAGMDDAAYQQAADHDKADLGKRQSSDSLNFATALITNTPQYQPKENHESAASAVLKRRQLHEQGQAGDKELRKALLDGWIKGMLEERKQGLEAERKKPEQDEKRRATALAESDAPWSPYGRDKEVYSGLGEKFPGTGPQYEESRSNREYAINNFGPQRDDVDPALRAEVNSTVEQFDKPLFSEAAKRAANIKGEQHRLDATRAQNGGGHGSFQIVTGPDGKIFGVSRRDPSQPAVPVIQPGGDQLTKQRKPIPEGAKTDLNETREIRDQLVALSKRFKDEYAGGGLLGGVATASYQALGSTASPRAQEDAAFWADFQRFIDIPERHQKFGASLTANEKQSWEQAKNLNPRADPKLVRQKFKELVDIVNKRLSSHADALRAEDYDPAAIESLVGASGGGPVQVASKAERDALPAGTQYVGPDGKTYTKR
jgi:hypothetical protein